MYDSVGFDENTLINRNASSREYPKKGTWKLLFTVSINRDGSAVCLTESGSRNPASLEFILW